VYESSSGCADTTTPTTFPIELVVTRHASKETSLGTTLGMCLAEKVVSEFARVGRRTFRAWYSRFLRVAS